MNTIPMMHGEGLFIPKNFHVERSATPQSHPFRGGLGGHELVYSLDPRRISLSYERVLQPEVSAIKAGHNEAKGTSTNLGEFISQLFLKVINGFKSLFNQNVPQEEFSSKVSIPLQEIEYTWKINGEICSCIAIPSNIRETQS